jgi:hypothetical protein
LFSLYGYAHYFFSAGKIAKNMAEETDLMLVIEPRLPNVYSTKIERLNYMFVPVICCPDSLVVPTGRQLSRLVD